MMIMLMLGGVGLHRPGGPRHADGGRRPLPEELPAEGHIHDVVDCIAFLFAETLDPPFPQYFPQPPSLSVAMVG